MDGKVNKKVIFGIAAILTIAFLGTIITGIASGWFNTVKTELSSEYYHADAAFSLDSAAYERLTHEKKSFLVITFQAARPSSCNSSKIFPPSAMSPSFITILPTSKAPHFMTRSSIPLPWLSYPKVA